MNHPLIQFYSGESPDHAGRYIVDIWAFSDEEIESTHDSIQWLFPIEEPSYFNRNTPKLTVEVVKAFHADNALREALVYSFDLMLDFYGLVAQVGQETGNIYIVKDDDYKVKVNNWQTGQNHNMLRITRILKSLGTLGCEDNAIAFYDCLQSLIAEDSKGFNSTSIAFWDEAIRNMKTR